MNLNFRRIAVLSVLCLSDIAHGEVCPDSGKVQFLNAQGAPGYFLQADYGKDGFTAYLHGKELEPKLAEQGEYRGNFVMDDVAYQHLIVEREQFRPADDPDLRLDDLNAHFKWEFGYVQGLARSGQVTLGKHKSFGEVETETQYGKKRRFWIWEAELAGAKQFFVTTAVPSGVISLTAIGVKPEQEEQVKAVIDNYMYRFASPELEDCADQQDRSGSLRQPRPAR